MVVRIIGALLVLFGCGSTGVLVALNVKRETVLLKNIISVIEYWKNELSFHLTPLPELCRQASCMNTGILSKFLEEFAINLENQIAPDAEQCVLTTLDTFNDISTDAKQLLLELACTLGKFDMEGQLSSFDSILKEANHLYAYNCNNQEVRLRSYKTLGICAGAALVILFI